MSATVFRGWTVAEPKMPPAERLAWALDLAAERFAGVAPSVVYVHPMTAAETPAREGLVLVTRPEVGRFGYWFPTQEIDGVRGTGEK